MKTQQLSIFLENKPGTLEHAIKAMSDVNVNIRAMSLADTEDFGILRLIANSNDAAINALQNAGFIVQLTDVVAVEVPDRPGGLYGILSLLSQKEINTEYAYAFIARSSDKAVTIFRFTQTDKAIRLLIEKGVSIIPGEQLYSM